MLPDPDSNMEEMAGRPAEDSPPPPCGPVPTSSSHPSSSSCHPSSSSSHPSSSSPSSSPQSQPQTQPQPQTQTQSQSQTQTQSQPPICTNTETRTKQRHQPEAESSTLSSLPEDFHPGNREKVHLPGAPSDGARGNDSHHGRQLLVNESRHSVAEDPEANAEEGDEEWSVPSSGSRGSIIAELEEDDEEGPETTDFFRVLLKEGMKVPGDTGVSLDSRPSWVDMDKVRLGQQFAQKYFFGLVFAEMLSLFLLFSSPGSLHTLIFSGNSDTPFKAFRRYLSTVTRVKAWYCDDLWREGGAARKHLQAVRRLHDTYRHRLNDAAPAKREERTRLQGPLWTTGTADAVRADSAAHADASRGPSLPREACPAYWRTATPGYEWINQAEMSTTQFGFVALAVLYPREFGAGAASEEELEAFVHLWRVVGHLLGVEERFNFCSGGLESTRARARLLVRRFMIPALEAADEGWEHMTRCVVEGVRYYVGGITYEVCVLYLCETLGVKAPRVQQLLTFGQRITYQLIVFVLRFALLLEPIRDFFNWLLAFSMKKVSEAPPEWLRRREARVYAYQRQHEAMVTRL